MNRSRTLLLLLLIHAAASFLHFAHNAIYIGAYPNLPVWITPPGVWASWCTMTGVGGVGYWLYRRVSQTSGLLIILLYAILGFGGLDHYAIAPVSAHTIAMNATIVTEVTTASLLMIFVLQCLMSRGRTA